MGRFNDADTPLELLQLLVGAASMCWEPRPSTAVFDSTEASKLADEALERLIELGWA